MMIIAMAAYVLVMTYFIFQLNTIFDLNILLQQRNIDYQKSDCDDQAKIMDPDLKGFVIVYKTPHPVSSEILTITSCWITKTSIQVGTPILFDANVTSPRYIENTTHYKNVTIKFLHSDMNYWNIPNDSKQNEYKLSSELTLYPDDSRNFIANKSISIRFTVPHNIAIHYCEYTINEKCFKIHDILQPAQYHLALQIETDEKLIRLTEILLFITLFTVIIGPSVSIFLYFKNNREFDRSTKQLYKKNR